MMKRYLPRNIISRFIMFSMCISLVLLFSPQMHVNAAQASLIANSLHVDYLVNPSGIDDAQPRLSWELASTAQNQVQQAYQIQAATSSSLLSASTPNVWDSGKVTSATSINVLYAGSALHSREQVYWQVRVWDSSGNASAWSPVASWEMGLLTTQDWSAQWISNASSSSTLPIFAKQFSLTKTISKAWLYMTGLGIYNASVNGKAVSQAVLQPAETNYLKRVIYSTYDVTSSLQQGANTLGVALGNGIANIQSNSRYNKFTGTQSTPRLFAQLEVTYSDGTSTRIVSDSSWRTTVGPTTFSDWYGGEDYDARQARTGWQTPGANLSSWSPATVTTAPSSQTVLSAQMIPSIQVVGTLHTVKITNPASGHYVFDLGTNFSGWEQLQVSGSAGTKITMTPGELLQSNGTVSQATTGSPIYDDYTLAGTGTETWHPNFVYHGFRYLDVTGLPSAPTTSTITGLELSTANASAGTLSTSNSLLNSVHKIVNQAIQNNMYSVLTDCPAREKLGWLEQDHLVFGAISRAYDVAAYYRELIRNISDSQTSSGLVPSISPEYTVFGGNYRDDPNWGSTLVFSAWQMYQTYGDVDTLRMYYSNMRRYLSYLQSRSSGNLLNYGLGEWAAIDTSTPVGVTATYAYYQVAQTMSRIATVLGHPTDVTAYTTLTQQIGSAFNTKYLAAAHNTYANGTQADDALALDMGVVPAQYQSAVVQHLANAIKANSYHLSVGEIALPALFHALSQNGQDSLLYTVTTQTTYPSYGSLVNSGATSLTEYWNGAANGTGSQDHFMLGIVNEWLSSHLGGIQADASALAYKKLVISPAVVGNLTQANSAYNTPYGQANSSWTRSGSAFQLQVTVPVNTTATVKIPVNASNPVATTGQGFQGFQNGYAVYNIGSGSYTFSSTM